jgi:hypothetical protein
MRAVDLGIVTFQPELTLLKQLLDSLVEPTSAPRVLRRMGWLK